MTEQSHFEEAVCYHLAWLAIGNDGALDLTQSQTLQVKARGTLEIEANIPSGVVEDTQRIVSENCQTLKFDRQGFEKS